MPLAVREIPSLQHLCRSAVWAQFRHQVDRQKRVIHPWRLDTSKLAVPMHIREFIDKPFSEVIDMRNDADDDDK